MIKLENITHFYGDEKALDNINLNINKGEFVALVGESGSGKSTLLSIASSLLTPKEGEVIIDNMNLKDIKNIDSFRKSTIGFVFQFHYLLNYLTLKENSELALGQKFSDSHFELAKKLGIEKQLDNYANEVSGGQRQRGAILRGIINTPKILFADEPTGNLDSKNTKVVFEFFKELKMKGMTILIATHDRSVESFCDRVLEVRDGSI